MLDLISVMADQTILDEDVAESRGRKCSPRLLRHRSERPCYTRAHKRDELAQPHRFPRAETYSALQASTFPSCEQVPTLTSTLYPLGIDSPMRAGEARHSGALAMQQVLTGLRSSVSGNTLSALPKTTSICHPARSDRSRPRKDRCYSLGHRRQLLRAIAELKASRKAHPKLLLRRLARPTA